MEEESFISLTNIQRGLRRYLGLDKIWDCRPAIFKAWECFKSHATTDEKQTTHYIKKSEFKKFLIALLHYFDIWVTFLEIDFEKIEKMLSDPLVTNKFVQISDMISIDEYHLEKVIDVEEFENVKDHIEKWLGQEITNVKEEFD